MYILHIHFSDSAVYTLHRAVSSSEIKLIYSILHVQYIQQLHCIAGSGPAVYTALRSGWVRPQHVCTRVGISVRFYRYADNRYWFIRNDISADILSYFVDTCRYIGTSASTDIDI